MRNDHQDALSAGLAVNEYAPASKSADEIRGLWQWVELRLELAVVDRRGGNRGSDIALASMPVVQTPAELAAVHLNDSDKRRAGSARASR